MIRICLRLALLLFDDFSGRGLTSPACRFTVGGRTVVPQRKPEGWYVFTGLPETGECGVDIRFPGYRPHTLRLDASGSPERVVRLLREEGNYPDCAFLHGAGPPGAPVLALRDTGLRLLSLSDDGGQSRLLFMGYDLQNLTGLRFGVGEGDAFEPFIAAARTEGGGYTAAERLTHPHDAGEPVLRAYYSVCGEKGEYCIPVDSGKGVNIGPILFYHEGKKKWDCLCAAAPS